MSKVRASGGAPGSAICWFLSQSLGQGSYCHSRGGKFTYLINIYYEKSDRFP